MRTRSLDPNSSAAQLMEKSFLTLSGLLVYDPLLPQEERKYFCIWKERDFQEE